MGAESHYYNNRPVLQGGDTGEWDGVNLLEITIPFKRRTGLELGKRKTQQTQTRAKPQNIKSSKDRQRRQLPPSHALYPVLNPHLRKHPA